MGAKDRLAGQTTTWLELAETERKLKEPYIKAKAEYEQALKKWQEDRGIMVQQYFFCPICGSDSFTSVIRLETQKTTGGVIMDVRIPVTDSYACAHCSARFQDPALFTSRRGELTTLLEELESRKPQPPK